MGAESKAPGGIGGGGGGLTSGPMGIKTGGRGVGLLPPKDVCLKPWVVFVILPAVGSVVLGVKLGPAAAAVTAGKLKGLTSFDKLGAVTGGLK